MARRSSRRKKGDSDFIRVTGLWKPSRGKSIGVGNVQVDTLEDILEAMEKNGCEKAGVFLMKNEYAESKRDPRYVLSVLPVNKEEDDDDDEDDRGKRRSRKRSSSAKRSRKRRDPDEDEDDDDLDDDDDDGDDDDLPPF
jgi:hypothetical protein